MSTTVPYRSSEQHMAALQRANRVRRLRSELRTDLTERRAADFIGRPPWWLNTMRLTLLLSQIHGWGPVKVRRTLVRCRVADTKTVGGLSDRQRAEILEALT